jgi:hypothetical protein
MANDMQYKNHPQFYVGCIAFFWVISFSLGCIYALVTYDTLASMMRAAVMQPDAGTLRIFFTALPFLFLLFFTEFSGLASIGILFIKAFSYGFCVLMLKSVFLSSAWLVCLLFLFSEIFSSILLLWLFMKRSSTNKLEYRSVCLKCLFLSCIVTALDVICVSPLLSVLF